MLTAFICFLVIEACFLIGACIYVSPLMAPGTRRPDAPPITIAPLPKAVAIPTAWRKARWP